MSLRGSSNSLKILVTIKLNKIFKFTDKYIDKVSERKSKFSVRKLVTMKLNKIFKFTDKYID